MQDGCLQDGVMAGPQKARKRIAAFNPAILQSCNASVLQFCNPAILQFRGTE
jgi:hypothetical protein